MLREWFIYSLIDPRTNEVRYIGWAYNVEKRVRDHISKARKQHNHKASWLVQLETANLRPLYQVLESGTCDWAEAERRWISYFRSEGSNLTNLTDGGEGIVGYVFSEETRRKMSAAKKGKKQTLDQRTKQSARLRGIKRPPELMKRIAKTRMDRGYKPSEETKQKIRNTVTGFRHTDEAKAKIAAAGKGRRHTDAARQKQADAKQGKSLSAEHKQKLSEAKKGIHLSEEHKRNISQATRHPQRCGACGEYGHKRYRCPKAL